VLNPIRFLFPSEIHTPSHLRVLYVSTFFLRLAFGAVILLLAFYAPSELDPALLNAQNIHIGPNNTNFQIHINETFENSSYSNYQMENCSLKSAKLKDSLLYNSSASECKIENSDIFNSIIVNCTIQNSKITECTLINCKLISSQTKGSMAENVTYSNSTTSSMYSSLLNVAIIAVPYPFAEMATANIFGMISDKIGRKKVIVFGTSLAACMVAAYTFTTNIWILAILHGIHGIGAAATVAPATAMIADYAHSKDRGRQMGLYDYSTFCGYILGPVLGGFAHNLFGVQISFYIVSGILVVSALILYKFVISEKINTSTKHRFIDIDEFKAVFKIREIREMFPIWLIMSTLIGIAVTYLPRIMKETGTSDVLIGVFFGVAGLFLGLLQPLWGRVSDKVGRLPVMYYGVFSVLGIILILLVFRREVELLNPVVIIPLALCGLGAGAFVPSALAMMADNSPQESYGSAMGLYSFALGFGSFIAETAGLLIIWFAKGDAINGLLYFAAALIGIATILMIKFFISQHIEKIREKKEK